MKRSTVASALLGTTMALLCWFALRSTDETIQARYSEPGEPLVPQGSPVDDRIRRAPLLPHSFTVVTTVHGRPSPGTLSWVAALEPFPWLPLLTNHTDERLRVIDHRGAARLEVSRGSWIWLCARARETGHPSAYAMIPAFAQDWTITLELRRPRLHICVLGPTWENVGVGQKVCVYTRELPVRGQYRLHRVVDTITPGYAVLDEVPDGQILVVAPSGNIDMPPPHTATCIGQPNSGTCDAFLTVVSPTPRTHVRMRVQRDTRLLGTPNAVYWRETTTGQTFPVPLRGDHTTISAGLDLPDGAYVLRAVPEGDVLVAPDGLTLQLPSAVVASLECRLGSQSRRTELVLQGLPDRVYPVRVSPLRPEEIRHDTDEELFLGPSQWHTATSSVGSLPSPALLVVTSSRGVWRTTAPVCISGPRVAADLESAARLKVSTVLPESGAKHVFAHLSARGFSESICLSRQLLSRPEGQRVGYAGGCVVPLGDISLECFGSDGATLWRRNETVTIRGLLVEEIRN